MKRLAINLNAVTLLLGLLLAGATCIVLAFQDHPPVRGSLFITAVACMWLTMTPIGLLTSLLRLLPERRLQAGFGLVDLYPVQSGYRRNLNLATSPDNLLRDVRSLIAERLIILGNTSESEGAGSATYRVRFGEEVDYEIAIAVGTDMRSVSISVRRLGFFARLATTELTAAQLLAGLVKWSADHGLVVGDFLPYVQPRRLSKDLGNWLPENDDWLDHPIDLQEAAELRRARYASFRSRILVAGMFALAAFAALVYIDAHAQPLPQLVKSLPILFLATYMLRQIVVRDRPRRRREDYRGKKDV
jgi:hypothetical protein